MSATKYLKCPCRKCGDAIEFPVHGIGAAVQCPHCGEKTTLFAPPIEEASTGKPPGDHSAAAATTETATTASVAASQFETSEPMDVEEPRGPGVSRRGKLVGLTLVVLAVVGLAAAGLIYKASRSQRTASPEERTKLSSKTSPSPVATNLASVPSNAPPPVKASKSLNDLKVGTIALEKARGSSLVYAVGVLRNDSEYQRFGVTIEVALSDARGNKAGIAKDYRAVIEPRQEWRFRALVLDSKAVSAQVERIREEE